jgi:hypothetical protein
MLPATLPEKYCRLRTLVKCFALDPGTAPRMPQARRHGSLVEPALPLQSTAGGPPG